MAEKILFPPDTVFKHKKIAKKPSCGKQANYSTRAGRKLTVVMAGYDF
jgi:hypothetical protein